MRGVILALIAANAHLERASWSWHASEFSGGFSPQWQAKRAEAGDVQECRIAVSTRSGRIQAAVHSELVQEFREPVIRSQALANTFRRQIVAFPFVP